MAKLPGIRPHMDRYLNILRPDMDIHDAVDFLLERRITGAPVVDESGNLVGMLTEKECLRLLAKDAQSPTAGGSVADFMDKDVQPVTVDMDIYFAAGLFLSSDHRRFPVMEAGTLVGVITRFDILRAIQANRLE